MTDTTTKTAGEKVVDELLGLTGMNPTATRNTWATIIDVAIAAAVQRGFKLGFEHAVEGGKEAARQVPALAGTEPLVLYFDNEIDRRGMIDAIHMAMPGLVEAHWPNKT